jgi:hypothetical protein
MKRCNFLRARTMYLVEKKNRERDFLNLATSTNKPLSLSRELETLKFLLIIRDQTSDCGEFTAGNLS